MNGKNNRNDTGLDYSQYDKNNKLSFAVASMMFEKFTHITVRRRAPKGGIEYLGGGDPVRIIKRYGDLRVVSSAITRDGLLQITVE